MRVFCCPVAKLCLTLCDPINCSTPVFPILHYLLESVMPSNHGILCRHLLLPSVFPRIRVFPSQSVLCIKWSNYWSFIFSITLSNEYSRLISFRIDWFGLLVVKGLSRIFSNTTIRKHQFFGAQPSLWSNSHIHT